MGVQTIETGVLGGIISGIIVYKLHERFHTIQLPLAFTFFEGARFVPIISLFTMSFVGIFIIPFVWPVYNSALYSAKGLVTIHGKSAHSGFNPEDGIHALVVASHAIERLKIGKISKNSSCNIGTVHGGIANNIVMPSVELSFEIRALHLEDLEQIMHTIDTQLQNSCAIFGATYTNAIN